MSEDIAAPEAPENIEAPPDFRAIIKSELRNSGLATSDDVTALRDEVRGLTARISEAEAILTALPKNYASAESVRKVTSSQAEYEASRRQLTAQFADMANVQADSQAKFTTIGAELATLRSQMGTMTAAVTTMTGNLNTFMRTQGERLDNQHSRLEQTDRRTTELARDVEFVKTTQVDAEQRYHTGFKPVHDFIMGSDTHKPLMTVIDGINSNLNTMAAQLTPAVEYIAAQKAKEAERHSFWQRVRLQMYTPRGIVVVMLAIIVALMLVNSLNFEQLNERIRQFAEAIGLLFSAVKGQNVNLRL